ACRTLCERLGGSQAALYWAAGDEYRLVASHPGTPDDAGPWNALSPLVSALSSTFGEPLPLAAFGETFGRAGARGSESPTQGRRDIPEAALAVPLLRGARLEGFFLLGRLSSGEPYGRHHSLFLERFAAAAAVLRESLATAGKQTELAAAEARQEARRAIVRLALGALKPPEEIAVPDLDCAGMAVNGSHCRVFLDMVSLPGRAAAFAAIELDSGFEEAAIRLIQLQALLRSRVRAYPEDLAELAESTRRALEGAGTGWPPAHLFLARYRAGARRLQYINAGFVPPFLFRRTAEGAQALRLRHTGPPLDAGAVFRCEEAEVELATGDLLLAVSSSVPAAPSAAGEPWGDARIIETLADWRPSSASALLELAAGAWKQHLGPEAELPPHLFLLLRPRP
ncbi:MAG: SpoIIE family protein phosphatase, partial [Bryobacteraceae bacterium]